MAKNEGKQFETDFISSIPNYCYCHRLRDSSQSFQYSQNSLYSWENECDFFVFDGNNRLFYAIECKSTKSKNMPFQTESDAKEHKSKMIKYHQIKSLTEISQYKGTVAGFLLNFRDEKNNMQRTYFIDIRNFNNIIRDTNKNSINEIDIIRYGAIKIQGTKKRVHYRWDINTLFSTISEIHNY